MAQSELLTHDGYPAVQLENGSHMTEYSITVTDSRLNGGKPTNIPSLWERKIVDQNTAVEKALQSKKEYKSFDTIKEAVSDSERKSNAGGANAPEGYNKGGAVRNLLATGGMLQEGGTTDPVSGNDVPTGALKEEVRDSVDAKLSVGEFVFPADVTRYIGLDKLMQIRDAAKEGLQEMESKGQMGNAEEVAADDSGNEDKFSSHIDEIIAGLDGGETKKFASGGAVNTSDYGAAPIKGFKMVQYEDVQTKTVKYIPFINGKPLLPIPKGYTEKKETVTLPTTPPPVVEQPVSPISGGGGAGDRGGDGGRDSGGEGGKTVNDAGVEGFGDIQGGTNRNVGRVAGLAAGLINPFAGLLVSAASQYAIKVNNEKMAEANAAAIDASALAAAGFETRDINAAKEAAAKATLDGKSAKDVAVAAANAASLSAGTALGKSVNGNYGAKTSLDALVGITNGWNTANKDVMSMPAELAGKIPDSMWSSVTAAIAAGMPAEQAVNAAVNSVEGQISLAKLDGQVPAGQFNNVAGYMQAGFTAKEAIDKVTVDQADADIAKQDAAEAADRAARDQEAKDAADRTAREAAKEAVNQAALDSARQEADQKEAAARAATEAAKRESEYAAERAQADKDAKDAAEREASREQADKANRDAVDRAAEQSAKDAADRAERDAAADRAERAEAADRAGSGDSGGYGGDTGAGDTGSRDGTDSDSGNSSGNDNGNNGGNDNGE